MTTKKYPVLSDINMGQYKRGDTIELSDADAEPLLKCGAIDAAIPEPPPAPPAKPAKAPKAEKPAATDQTAPEAPPAPPAAPEGGAAS